MKWRECKLIQDIKKYKWLILTLIVVIFSMSHFFHTTCPSKLIFGLPCPGCGITRAAELFLYGHPIEAFFMNPSFYLWLFFGIYIFVFHYILKRKIPYLIPCIFVLVLGTIVVYIVGMYKYFPYQEPYTITRGKLAENLFPYYGKFLESIK